ncbi:MAG: carboxypeptidase regulatory-like domain-containing protein [Bauldia sp.]|nr:MAG: carboxypeptidase regulatory-like domain-containing protein [Bauldia sp.]MBZ0231201.1 carboxypeptidase-like regulatory domain-containing protein [Kofleriaceae bacterium]
MKLFAFGVLALLIAVAAAACTPPPAARTATFRQRPDAVAPGNLTGPFTGRVLDAANRAPVTGAVVYATWTFERSTPLPVAAGYKEAVASTDATGRYRLPELTSVPSGARVTDFALVIYKRGFVAYRSDRRFGDFGARRDFSQLENQVMLERWRPEYSHARHVRFVGGGGVIAAVTEWEAEVAIGELDPDARRPTGPLLPTTGDGPNLVAAQLIKPDEIKARTRFDGTFETGPLGDEPDTATYSSQHFRALGRNESFDVAIRLWRVGPAGALDRYDELRTGLPGVEEKDEIASRSLRATENDIYGVGFLDGQRGVVVLITCGKSQCSSIEDAVALGHIAHRRIKEIWPLDRSSGGLP